MEQNVWKYNYKMNFMVIFKLYEVLLVHEQSLIFRILYGAEIYEYVMIFLERFQHLQSI